MARSLTTFWRLAVPAGARLDQPTLAAGLTRHLRHSPLVLVLVQIAAEQQAYVRVQGCRSCADGGRLRDCAVGCHAALFARALAAGGVPDALTAVPGGLVNRLYTRAALLTPAAPTAAALDGTALAPWSDARLILHWRPGPDTPHQLGACLLVGVDGPPPTRAAPDGWQARRAIGWLVRRRLAPIPSGVSRHGPWHADPYLLFPCPPGNPLPHVPPPDAVPAVTAASAALPSPVEPSLVQLLRRATIAGRMPSSEAGRAVDATRQPGVSADAPPAEHASDIWPDGPGNLRAAQVAAIVWRVLHDPAFTDGAEPGVTKNRLKAAGAGADALALLVWMDAAGLLAPPSKDDPIVRWREARPLISADPADLAARLRATPLPLLDTLAWAGMAFAPVVSG